MAKTEETLAQTYATSFHEGTKTSGAVGGLPGAHEHSTESAAVGMGTDDRIFINETC